MEAFGTSDSPQRELGPAGQPSPPGRPSRVRRIYGVLLVCWLLAAVYGNLVPLRPRWVSLHQGVEEFRQIRYYRHDVQSRADLVANFLLFLPLTFFAMGALASRRGIAASAFLAILAVVGACALAVAIEFAQIFFRQRTVSRNDIYAEAIGGLAGVALWASLGNRITRWLGGLRARRSKSELAVGILGVYAVLLVLYQLFPFDLTLNLAEMRHELKGAKPTFFTYGDPLFVAAYGVTWKVAVMVPIGFALALRRGRAMVAGVSIAVLQAAALAGTVELGQCVIFSRSASLADFGLGAGGGLLGAAAAFLVGPKAPTPVLESAGWASNGGWIKAAASLGAVAALVWEKWRPFEFAWPERGLAAMQKMVQLAPFTRLYWLGEYRGLTRAVRELTWFFLLGLLLGRLLGARRRRGRVLAGAIVLVLAAVLELGKVYLPARRDDLTIVLINVLGGIAGVWLAERFVSVFLRADRSGAEPAGSGAV